MQPRSILSTNSRPSTSRSPFDSASGKFTVMPCIFFPFSKIGHLLVVSSNTFLNAVACAWAVCDVKRTRATATPKKVHIEKECFSSLSTDYSYHFHVIYKKTTRSVSSDIMHTDVEVSGYPMKHRVELFCLYESFMRLRKKIKNPFHYLFQTR